VGFRRERGCFIRYRSSQVTFYLGLFINHRDRTLHVSRDCMSHNAGNLRCAVYLEHQTLLRLDSSNCA